MKISYQTVGGGGWTTLFDQAAVAAGGAVLEEFAPEFKPANQVEPLFRSDAQFKENRGNVLCSLPIRFNTEYASLQLAVASVRAMAVLLTLKVHLKVEQDGETQYYPNAVCDGYQFKLAGASAWHAFVFTSDKVTDTPP